MVQPLACHCEKPALGWRRSNLGVGSDVQYGNGDCRAFSWHGAYGTMKSLPVERLYRDAKMTEVYVGVSEIQRAIIAGHLIK
jgi:hypothetical protein